MSQLKSALAGRRTSSSKKRARTVSFNVAVEDHDPDSADSGSDDGMVRGNDAVGNDLDDNDDARDALMGDDEEDEDGSDDAHHNPKDGPSTADLAQFMHTKQLFRSNLFRLEVDELLDEVRVDYDRTSATTGALELIQQLLSDAKGHKVSVDSHQLTLDHPLRPKRKRTSIQWAPPASMHTIGSFATQTTLSSDRNVDLAVQIPASCLSRKDGRNGHSYLDKRRLYLAGVAHVLLRHKALKHLHVVAFCGDVNKPILTIKPKPHALWKRIKSTFVIRIIPFILPNEPIPLASVCSLTTAATPSPSTAHVQHAVVEDMLMLRHLSHLQTAVRECPALRDAVCMFKVWLKQRDLHVQHGSFNGFLMSMLLCTLLSRRKLHSSMSSYQLFRVALAFLATWRFTEKEALLWTASTTSGGSAVDALATGTSGLFNSVLRSSGHRAQQQQHQHDDEDDVEDDDSDGDAGDIDEAVILQHARELWPIVWIDSSMCFNLAWRCTRAGMEELQCLAKTSLTLLDEVNDSISTSAIPSFNSLFITPYRFHIAHDMLIRLKLAPLSYAKWCHLNPQHAHVLQSHEDHDEGHQPQQQPQQQQHVSAYSSHSVALTQHAIQTLHRALVTSGRATCIAYRRTSVTPFPLKRLSRSSTSASTSSWSSHDSVLIGIQLNVEMAFKAVQMGPSPTDVEAAEDFRQFWGERAEVRRFREGSIVEAVVWNADEGEEHTIPSTIAKYVLNRHMKLPKHYVHFIVNPFDAVALTPPQLVQQCGSRQRVNTFSQINAAFLMLSRMLRDVNGLPLSVDTVRPLSAVLAHAEVFPPPCNVSNASTRPTTDGSLCVQPIPIMVQFRTSGAWPEDLDAIARIKTSFYITLSRSLTAQFGASHVTCLPHRQHLDVLLSGFVFRCYIFRHREVPLMKSVSVAKAAALRHTFVVSPQWRSTLASLHAHNQSLGPAIRLAKRWLNAHLFSGHYCDEMVEMMMSYVFVHSEPFATPSTPTSAFYRFLHLVAHFDWTNSPLLLSVHGDVTGDVVDEIMHAFESQRRQQRARDVPFIGSFVDRTSTVTSVLPTECDWKRMHSLAVQSLAVIDSVLRCSGTPVVSRRVCNTTLVSIFNVDLSVFDVVIHLDAQQLPNAAEAIPTMEVAQSSSVKSAKKKQRVSSSSMSSSTSNWHQLSRYKNLIPMSDNLIEQMFVGFNPAQRYVHEVNARFGSIALVYWDANGGSKVGLKWRPSAWKPQRLRVANATAVCCAGGNRVLPNAWEIHHDLWALGQGLVADVQWNVDVPAPQQ